MSELGFLFFPSFDETLEVLRKSGDKEGELFLFHAIRDYCFRDIEPEDFPSDICAVCWKAIKPNLENSRGKMNQKKRSIENGKKGGRKPKAKPRIDNSENPDQKPSTPKNGNPDPNPEHNLNETQTETQTTPDKPHNHAENGEFEKPRPKPRQNPDENPDRNHKRREEKRKEEKNIYNTAEDVAEDNIYTTTSPPSASLPLMVDGVEFENGEPKAGDFEIHPPEFEDVYKFAQENKLTAVNVVKFMDYYNDRGWIDIKTRAPIDWQRKLYDWNHRDLVMVREQLGKD